MDSEMKSKKYTYFSERNYAGKGYKIDEKVVDYWKKVLGDNVFNNIEKVYKIRPEIIISDKDFELAAEPKEILQLSELFHKGLGKMSNISLKLENKKLLFLTDFLIISLSLELHYLMNKISRLTNVLWIIILIIFCVKLAKFQ